MHSGFSCCADYQISVQLIHTNVAGGIYLTKMVQRKKDDVQGGYIARICSVNEVVRWLFLPESYSHAIGQSLVVSINDLSTSCLLSL